MAYSNSLLLVTFFLIATTSLVKSDIFPLGNPLAVIGTAYCPRAATPNSLPLVGVIVKLSCDEDQTTVVADVTTGINGVFVFVLNGQRAAQIESGQCFAYIDTRPNCSFLGGRQLWAPIVPVDLNIPGLFFKSFHVAILH